MRGRLPLLAGTAVFVALLLGLALPRLGGSSSERTDCASRPSYSPERATPEAGYQVSAELEDLTQTIAPKIRERWGGSWANSDERVTIAIVGTEPLPPEAKPLTDHPHVSIVRVRHTTAQLDQAIQQVTSRLNELLALGLEPGTHSPWPYSAHVDTKGNVVEVTVDERHRERCREIEAVLADELDDGTVRIDYGRVEEVSPL